MTGFAFDTHVAAQPDVIESLLDHDVPRLDPLRPVIFTGIGTSLHACRVAAAWTRQVTGGRVRPAALDAHDLALLEPIHAEDQIVVVSHRGTKRYPNLVLEKARHAGAQTVAITGEGAAEPAADVVVRTCPQEQAGTHTVSYTASLTVLARLIAATFDAPWLADALKGVPGAMRDTLTRAIPDAAVDALARSAPAVVTGTGLDAVTADEAALKIKEGTYRWAEGMHTEFALHGTPAVFSPETVAFVYPTPGDGGRSSDLRALFIHLGASVLTVEEHGDLTFAPTDPLVRPLVSVLPMQRLVSATALRLGADPDLTHLESEPWTTAIRAVQL
ncbi:SIS domain-containing protein [Nocardia salmonicida]